MINLPVTMLVLSVNLVYNDGHLVFLLHLADLLWITGQADKTFVKLVQKLTQALWCIHLRVNGNKYDLNPVCQAAQALIQLG